VTRGQFSKIASQAANFSEVIPSDRQSFEDVPPGSTFWLWVERLYGRQVIGGYPCGGTNEPCIEPLRRPYFRPNANATRAQIARITALSRGYVDPPTGQSFEDVPPGSTFYVWIENLASRDIISGYPCGGANEPCGPANLPYFRQVNNATRGQVAKIIANTFFPGCDPP
jgi:hypothetical protein